MGATKRLSEVIVRAIADVYPDTNYASVRFGNVLGSRGSVVPTFRRQIEAGGPVTVTHPEIKRYFMAIPEAVSLVLQAGAVADSYGTYILEMGRPVMIVDLAKKMLEIMGAKNVRIQYTGLRPGRSCRRSSSRRANASFRPTTRWSTGCSRTTASSWTRSGARSRYCTMPIVRTPIGPSSCCMRASPATRPPSVTPSRG